MNKLKMLELFGGIGAPRKALSNIGLDFKVIDYVEIDKYAVNSYNAMYNESYEPQDICEWNKELDIDMIFHGSPCTDVSIAGKQQGADKDSGTRSSLMYETIRIVKSLNPKYVVWENVKNLLGKKHVHNFENYLNTMKNLGYTNFYKVLSAEDYGIPQSRQRVFTISIKSDSAEFNFPQPIKLNKRMCDFLDFEVDEKYYYSLDRCQKLINVLKEKGLGKELKQDCVGRIDINGHDYLKRVYNPLGISPTLGTVCGGNQELKIAATPNSREYHGFRDVCPTLTARDYKDPKTVLQGYSDGGYTIRKATPREYWRLMGFTNSDFDKASSICSNTQLYKQAGNSIVVNVLEEIFKNLFKTR